MAIEYRPEGRGWQTAALSALFAILMTVAGWLYTGGNARQDEIAKQLDRKSDIDNIQNERAAVQENETKNLKDSILRMEQKIDRVDSKLDMALRKQ